ncbi:hypothetical protein BN3087_550008 [Sulfurovum sp. enrichment culture clone C5]|uniref:Uncharacterized protein n=1 Tax=Sulfurovum sp. enrichment culture clone C5 TaxID=497650 RepID=A0A0S4XPU8_9BACT|nr:hypothetical protein BN3087_550008 [Sulfurovum sp. enrichment culture clone C5]
MSKETIPPKDLKEKIKSNKLKKIVFKNG